MRKKPGGVGGRGRTVALVRPSCVVCFDRKVLQFVAPEMSEAPERVRCPHCTPPYAPIQTYFHQGKQ